MHDHDEQLIVDLLSETGLTDSEVRTRLEGCEACAADVEEQRSVTQLLGSLNRPLLTNAERSSLHTSVSAQLDAETVIELPMRRGLDWSKVGAVAAVFVGLVAVAGLITSITGGDDASDAADLAATTIESAAAESGEPDDGAAELALDQPAEAAPMADAAADDEADTAIGTIAPPSNLVRSLQVVTAETFNLNVEESLEDVLDAVERSGILRRSLDATTAACYDGLDEVDLVRAVVTGEVDGTKLEAYIYSDGEVVVLATDGCEVSEVP